ncbi:hypothetical protein L209DRAFT_437995 [Thermothelomyces heterothallicus CBS 203.75]
MGIGIPQLRNWTPILCIISISFHVKGFKCQPKIDQRLTASPAPAAPASSPLLPSLPLCLARAVVPGSAHVGHGSETRTTLFASSMVCGTRLLPVRKTESTEIYYTNSSPSHHGSSAGNLTAALCACLLSPLPALYGRWALAVGNYILIPPPPCLCVPSTPTSIGSQTTACIVIMPDTLRCTTLIHIHTTHYVSASRGSFLLRSSSSCP